MARDALVTSPGAPPDAVEVLVVDNPSQRSHLPADLIRLGVTLLGIALVLLLGAYASGTTTGITQDVQGFYTVLHRIFVAPVNILEGAVTLVVPVVIILSLAVRREPRRIMEAILALALAMGVALLAAETTHRWGAPELVNSLSVTANGLTAITMPAYLAGLAAMLTTAGRRRVFRPISISWDIFWAAIVFAAVSGFVTLPAALATVFIGRAVGLLARWALGAPTDRAYGDALVDAIRRAGFEPKRLIRVDAQTDLSTYKVDPVCLALARSRQGRFYELTTVEGHQLFAVALDGDQVAAGTVARLWRSIKVRGIDSRPSFDLRHVAESTALVSHAARTAGVHTARVLGMAQARDTMVLVYQRPGGCRAFGDLAPEAVTDVVIDAIWAEVLKAHRAGITHRALTSDTVLVCPEDGNEVPAVWLSSWEMGEVASGTFSRSVDAVQLIAMIAAKVGAKRAVDSAFRVLPEFEVAALAPFLQGVLLPRSTRIETRSRGHVLRDVRGFILDRLPEAPSEPQRISRFSVRTVLTIGLGIVAAYLVLTTFNAQAVIDSIGRASPWWVVAVVGWMLMTFVGASLSLIAFSPVKLPFGRALLAQMASGYMALAVPAGVGPAYVNHSLLAKRGVPRPLALATVALMQVSGIVVTVLGLVTLSLVTGDKGALAAIPSKTALIAVGIVAVVVAATLTFPKVRQWAATKVMPTLRQTWPRLVDIVSQPWRLLLGVIGSLTVTASYVAALYSSLRAFGQQPSIVDVAIMFLLASAAGVAIPTPGGLGTIEVTLATVLTTTAGIPVAIAGSVVVLYRGVTFWLDVPIGWVSMVVLQKKKEI